MAKKEVWKLPIYLPIADEDTKGLAARREKFVVGELDNAQLHRFACLDDEPKLQAKQRKKEPLYRR